MRGFVAFKAVGCSNIKLYDLFSCCFSDVLYIYTNGNLIAFIVYFGIRIPKLRIAQPKTERERDLLSKAVKLAIAHIYVFFIVGIVHVFPAGSFLTMALQIEIGYDIDREIP